GREPRDGTAVSILAKVILAGDFGEDFVAKKAHVAIAHRIVQGAAHRVFERTTPVLRIGLHKLVGGGSGRIGNVTGTDENTNHHGNSLLRDQIIDHVQSWIVTVA